MHKTNLQNKKKKKERNLRFQVPRFIHIYAKIHGIYLVFNSLPVYSIF